MQTVGRNFSRYKEVFLYVVTLCFFQLYNYVGFPPRFVHVLLYLALLCTIFLCRKTLFLMNTPQLFNLMRWLWILTFFSMFMAWLFRGQGLFMGFKATAQYLVFIFFFYLYKTKPPVEKLEKYILAFGILAVLLWLYAASQFPANVFGYSEEDEITDVSRGLERMRGFIGKISMAFALFLAVNKFYDTKKKIYILLAAMFFVIIVLQLTRMLILSAALVTVYYVWVRSKRTLITVVCVIVAVVVSGVSLMDIDDDSVVGSLINISENQIERQSSGEEDIRITELKYMFGEHNKNLATNLFGSGYPSSQSAYGRAMVRLNEMRRIYFTDVGYGDIYAINGLVGLLLYLFIYYKCLTVPLPQHLHYVKMFILFLIVANLTSNYYARVDGQIAMSICVYVLIAYRAYGKDVSLLNMFKDCNEENS